MRLCNIYNKLSPPPPEIDVFVNSPEGCKKERKGVSALAFFFVLQHTTVLFGVSMDVFWHSHSKYPKINALSCRIAALWSL